MAVENKSIQSALCFQDAQEWHDWLQQNHGIATEVWLVHGKKNRGVKCLGMAEAVEEALCFGWIDSLLRSLDETRYALRYTPRRTDSVWSQSNREKVEKLIALGRMTEAGLKTVEEAKRRGSWQEAYTDREAVQMPPDLAAELSKNETAASNFAWLPVSHRNAYVRWVMSAKTEATRQRRTAETVKRVAEGKRPAWIETPAR